MVTNLVFHAVKCSSLGTRATVRVARREPYVLQSVPDEGPGIRKEDTEAIFQPFDCGRFADTFTEGAGMGLYVVQRIVEAHGGPIDVENKPGHGTTVVAQPRAQAPAK